MISAYNAPLRPRLMLRLLCGLHMDEADWHARREHALRVAGEQMFQPLRVPVETVETAGENRMATATDIIKALGSNVTPFSFVIDDTRLRKIWQCRRAIFPPLRKIRNASY